MPNSRTIDMILDQIGYVKFPEHMRALYDKHRVILVTGGRRSGKSSIAAAYLLTRYWLGARYAIIGVDYELCRYEFEYLMKWAYELKIVEDCHFPSRDQCRLVLSRGPGVTPAVIETKSAKYPERIAGVAYDGALLVEAAQLPYEIFNIVQGRLVEKNGWMLISGTMEVMGDWFVDKSREYAIPENIDGGVIYSVPSWANKVSFEGGRNDPKLVQQEATLGNDLFMMTYGSEIIVPKDLVLNEFKSSFHVGKFPYVPEHPVYLGVDPGHYPSVYAVVFIQIIDDEIYVIDEIYQQHLGTEQIILMVEQKPFYSAIEGGAIDIGAKQHHGDKSTNYETWRSKLPVRLTYKYIPIEDGIDRVRPFFIPDPIHGRVRLHINNSCKGLISELGGCKSPFADEGRGSWRMKSNGKPDDKNCDSVKSLIYCVVDRYGLKPRRKGAAVSYLKEVYK